MALVFSQVGYSYPETPDVAALHNVSFTLEPGELLAIVGHTGSGKTTLVQHCNGILTPTTGSVTWNGQGLGNKKAAHHAREAIGVVFQYPEHQLFAQSVAEDVGFGPKNQGLSDKEIDERVRMALALVELDYDTVAETSPFKLSGGQQRRVALAGVLAMKPHVLILDEPTAGLDPQTHRSFLALIDSLHCTQNMSIIMVSHDMDDVAQVANRVMVLDHGTIAALDTPLAVFQQEELLARVGLALPSAQRMASELRALGMPLHSSTLYTITSLAQELATLYQ